MDRYPEANVVGLSSVENVSIRATTQYTRAILCTQKNFRNEVNYSRTEFSINNVRNFALASQCIPGECHTIG